MESTGFGVSALLALPDQTAESVSSDCFGPNHIIHAWCVANMQSTHNDSSCPNIFIAVWYDKAYGWMERGKIKYTPMYRTRVPPSPLFLGPLMPQGSEVVPPPYSHSHTNTQKTNYPVTPKFSSSALLFRPDSVHLFCQASIWEFSSRLCSCGIWMTIAGVPVGFFLWGKHNWCVTQRAAQMADELVVQLAQFTHFWN